MSPYKPEGPEVRLWHPLDPLNIPRGLRHLPGQPVTVLGWHLMVDPLTLRSSWWAVVKEMPPALLIAEAALVKPKQPPGSAKQTPVPCEGT
jgi:hypothetical protein